MNPKITMPKLQVEIPDALKKDLRVYTFEHGLTLSEATQEALEEWLGKQGYKDYSGKKKK